MAEHATTARSHSTSFLHTAKKEAPPFFPPVTVQPKLTVGAADDPYEREADATADKVMRMPNESVVHAGPAPAVIQRKCAACEQEEKGALQLKPVPGVSIQRKCAACGHEEHDIQRKETAANAPVKVSAAVHQTLQSAGHPLDAGTRTFMETRFGHDFSNVQVHTNSLAGQSATDISARAYTHDRHIVFGAGQYQPHTQAGKQLLAHELTHVVQQGASAGVLSGKAAPEQPVHSSPVPVNLQRQFEGLEDAGLGDDPPSCPNVPTNEGNETPAPACATATHTGAAEVARFNFCEDSKQLTDPSQLNELNRVLKNNPAPTHFLVHGYASIEGDPAYNFRLACHRANAISAVLATRLRNGMSGLSKDQKDAEVAARIETASQGPTTQFSDGLAGNRITVVYAQKPGGKEDEEPGCEDAPKHLGDVKPEINCDKATEDLIDRPGSEQLRPFFFCADSDVLTGESVEAIKQFAFKQAAKATFVVHGFASEEGDAAYNQRLSCHRALRIARELMKAGVRTDQIREVSGLGETTHFDDREFNRVVLVLAEEGRIDLLKDGARKADTDAQKTAILNEALDNLNAGQYRLEADAYISFWTCGRTATVRDAVKRLRILLPKDNEDEPTREKANGTEEGLGANTIRLANNAFHAKNPVECVTGRIIDMSFHHAVVGDTGLSPDLVSPSDAEARHRAGLHLIALAGFTACTGRHASAGEQPGRGLTGIDEPLDKDPRSKIAAPLCTQAPQPTRLLTPPQGAKGQELPDFLVYEKAYTPASGLLASQLTGKGNDTRFVSQTVGNVMNASATVLVQGDPGTFANYEIGFIQTILEDLNLAEYFSGRIAVQQLPVPVRTTVMKGGLPAPAPWMALKASAVPDAKGKVDLKAAWTMNTDVALLVNHFMPEISGQDILDTWNRRTKIALWLVARRRGAPLDRFSVIFIDGMVYDLAQNLTTDMRRKKGELVEDNSAAPKAEDLFGDKKEEELVRSEGSFQALETSAEMGDTKMARFGNPSSGEIDLDRQTEKILAPAATTEADGMDKAEYAAEVKNILDNLELFPTREDADNKTNGTIMPRLGFVFIPLTIHVSIDRRSGRMLPFLGNEKRSVTVESVSAGKAVLFQLAKALALRLGKRDFRKKGRSVVLKPSAIPGTGPVGVVTISLPPMLPEVDLSKDGSVQHDMAELWACSESTLNTLEVREFAIAYWMDRDKVLHRFPENGIIRGRPDDLSGSLTTIIPCGPPVNKVGFAMGHVHTHPEKGGDDALPSPPDKKRVASGACGNKYYIVSTDAVFAYFPSGATNKEGNRSDMLRGDVKCDPSRWRDF